jgi:hypothetical protein
MEWVRKSVCAIGESECRCWFRGAYNWKAELDEDNRGELSFLVWSQKQLRMDILNEIALQE